MTGLEDSKNQNKVMQGISKSLYELLMELTEKLETDYRILAQKYIQEWTAAQESICGYNVCDEIKDSLEEKLKSRGVPYMVLDLSEEEKGIFVFPASHQQFIETTALEVAKEYDEITQISQSEINDLCFGKEKMDRYDLSVKDEALANRIRENLTGRNLNTIFSMEEVNGEYVFSCTKDDVENLNKAFFEAVWDFTGANADLHKKQEEWSLGRQKEMNEKMTSEGHYFIIDAELDKYGKPTGNIIEKIEVTDTEIALYKTGEKPTDIIPNNKTEEVMDRFQCWTDRQTFPVVVDASEIENWEQIAQKQARPYFMTKEQLEVEKINHSNKKATEKKIERALRHPLGMEAKEAILGMIEQYDKAGNKYGLDYKEKSKDFEWYLTGTEHSVHKITSQDLSSIDRSIEYNKEKSQEIIQEINKEIERNR